MNTEKAVKEIVENLEKMWRIEMMGDDALTQLWRDTRNKAGRLKEIESEIARYDKWIAMGKPPLSPVKPKQRRVRKCSTSQRDR